MNENIFAASTVSISSLKLLTHKNLERIMRKSVQSKRKCFTEKNVPGKEYTEASIWQAKCTISLQT